MRIKLYGLEQPAVDSHGPAKYTVSLAEFICMNTSGSQNGSKQQWAATRKATSSVYTRVLTYIQEFSGNYRDPVCRVRSLIVCPNQYAF